MTLEPKKIRLLRSLIVKAADSLSDGDALDATELFDKWAVGIKCKEGIRYTFGDVLYRCKQTHDTQADWTPDIATSLFEKVARPGQGDTPDNPIPYSGNMALNLGKYYEQFGIVYVCTRDTINPVYADLKDLVGLYVEIVSE